jgi:hypothetical protein
MEFPWPVTNRDVVFHIQITHDPETKAATIRLTAAPAYTPETDNVRMQQSTGEYVFEPAADGMVNVTWRQHAEPAGGIPQWLINAMLVDIPFNSLKALQQLAQNQPYHEAQLRYSAESVAEAFQNKSW